MKPVLLQGNDEYKENVLKKNKKKKQVLIDMYSFECKKEESICDYIDTNLGIFRRDVKPKLNVTELYISAISAKAKMGISFELGMIYNALEKYCTQNKNCAIQGLIHGEKSYGTIKKPRKKGKGFPNCLSFVIESENGKNVTGKIFSDKKKLGNSISMVGCRVEGDGISIIKRLQDIINSIPSLSSVSDTECIIGGFEKTMINSNYSIGIKIDRELFFSFLSENYPNIFSSYTPASGYTAVKIGFYFNSSKEVQDGVCDCPGRKCTLKKSSGKGSGDKIGECKIITMAVFENSIIITGGRHIYQNISACEFLTKILVDNIRCFAHINLSFPEENIMLASYITLIPLI